MRVRGLLTVRPFYRWYDLWVGAYWDRKERVLYLCVLGFGLKIFRKKIYRSVWPT